MNRQKTINKKPHLNIEKQAWARGLTLAGIDEVGRGCLAGPVVAACVVFPDSHVPIADVRDSKKLTAKKREALFSEILLGATDFGVGLVSAEIIDEIGIGLATKEAMVEAVGSLQKTPGELAVDAIFLETLDITQKTIIKGDESVYSIAAASIVAKVFRDRLVTGFDNIYPEYGFSSHKGYGTKAHYAAIEKHGVTKEHRKTFLKGIA